MAPLTGPGPKRIDQKGRIRRPCGYWNAFNSWWRDNKEACFSGEGPVATTAIQQWYELHAKDVWPEETPTLDEVVTHSHNVRSKESTRLYFRQWRAQRRAEHEPYWAAPSSGTRSRHHQQSSGSTEEDGSTGDEYEDRSYSGRKPRHHQQLQYGAEPALTLEGLEALAAAAIAADGHPCDAVVSVAVKRRSAAGDVKHARKGSSAMSMDDADCSSVLPPSKRHALTHAEHPGVPEVSPRYAQAMDAAAAAAQSSLQVMFGGMQAAHQMPCPAPVGLPPLHPSVGDASMGLGLFPQLLHQPQIFPSNLQYQQQNAQLQAAFPRAFPGQQLGMQQLPGSVPVFLGASYGPAGLPAFGADAADLEHFYQQQQMQQAAAMGFMAPLPQVPLMLVPSANGAAPVGSLAAFRHSTGGIPNTSSSVQQQQQQQAVLGQFAYPLPAGRAFSAHHRASEGNNLSHANHLSNLNLLQLLPMAASSASDPGVTPAAAGAAAQSAAVAAAVAAGADAAAAAAGICQPALSSNVHIKTEPDAEDASCSVKAGASGAPAAVAAAGAGSSKRLAVSEPGGLGAAQRADAAPCAAGSAAAGFSVQDMHAAAAFRRAHMHMQLQQQMLLQGLQAMPPVALHMPAPGAVLTGMGVAGHPMLTAPLQPTLHGSHALGHQLLMMPNLAINNAGNPLDGLCAVGSSGGGACPGSGAVLGQTAAALAAAQQQMLQLQSAGGHPPMAAMPGVGSTVHGNVLPVHRLQALSIGGAAPAQAAACTVPGEGASYGPQLLQQPAAAAAAAVQVAPLRPDGDSSEVVPTATAAATNGASAVTAAGAAARGGDMASSVGAAEVTEVQADAVHGDAASCHVQQQ